MQPAWQVSDQINSSACCRPGLGPGAAPGGVYCNKNPEVPLACQTFQSSPKDKPCAKYQHHPRQEEGDVGAVDGQEDAPAPPVVLLLEPPQQGPKDLEALQTEWGCMPLHTLWGQWQKRIIWGHLGQTW